MTEPEPSSLPAPQSTPGAPSGRTLVFGATGNVGWGLARALQAVQAPLLLVTRDDGQAQRLRAEFSTAEVVVDDVSTAEGAERIAAAAAQLGDLRHVFASIGPWWQKGPIADQPLTEWPAIRAAALDGQVFAAMALIRALRDVPGTSYTLVTGQGGHMSIRGTGLLVTAVQGVFGLSRMLRAEHEHRALRVNELLIRARIERSARPGVVPAEAFGAALVPLLAAPPGEGPRGAVLTFDDPASFAPQLRGG
jgi:NAD(P)-dependent dehydrogenase (short-subunit alcohol dehydrogenase family)